MNEKWEYLLSCIPVGPSWNIDWEKLEQTGLQQYLKKMKETMQNPAWHGEGDVWTHTKMVCTELVSLPFYQRLSLQKKQEVFLAALLHDIGKISCTKKEDGIWVSPNHTVVGSKLVRSLLWVEYDLAGSKEKQNIRETICNLIRYHSAPTHIWEKKVPEQRLIKIAANSKLAGDFSMELLLLLVEADIRGRICADTQENLEALELCRELLKETNCFYSAYPFESDYIEHAYLNEMIDYMQSSLHDNTWGEVILLCGMPGTGKDTWIQKNYPHMPMVSLDHFRKKLGISPKEEQGKVVQAAREAAKEYLRQKQPFIWNATDLTPMIRGKQVRLFEAYHARVRIVFLETGWQEELERNRGRKEQVPEAALKHMIDSLVMPEQFEAQKVEWYCI